MNSRAFVEQAAVEEAGNIGITGNYVDVESGQYEAFIDVSGERLFDLMKLMVFFIVI